MIAYLDAFLLFTFIGSGLVFTALMACTLRAADRTYERGDSSGRDATRVPGGATHAAPRDGPAPPPPGS